MFIFTYSCEIKSNFSCVDIEVTKIHNMLLKNNETNNEIVLMIDFVLRELLNNAVEHGNGMVEEKRVSLTISLTSKELLIGVCDEGKGDKIEEYIKNQDEVDNLRLRNRGLLAIHNLGFILENVDGYVKASYNIQRNLWEF